MADPKNSLAGSSWPRVAAVAITLLSMLALGACGGGTDRPASLDEATDAGLAQAEAFSAKAAPTAAEWTERVEIGGLNTVPSWHGESLETLMERQHYIVVARVIDVATGYPYAESLVDQFIPKTPLPPDHLKANVTPDPDGKIGPVGSQYLLEVVQVMRAKDLAVGDSFYITDWGGIIDGVRYEDMADPLLEVGTSYLLFLDKPGAVTFTGLPFARFEILPGGRLHPVTDHWSRLGVVVQLEDLMLDEAIARVEYTLLSLASR